MASGYLFRKFRELRGLTQKALGLMINLDDVRVRQYEFDKRNPKEDVWKISQKLSMSSRSILKTRFTHIALRRL